MKYFNPIEREFVAPVELDLLDKTYSTLQQRHDVAIDTYSKLDQAIAQLDLNEAEDGWKQGKRNEALSILENGTIDGLSAFTRNDLVKASTNMLFGPDTLGRLKRQKAWKENNAKIDAMNIPESYKQNYKEMNPYSVYEDKYTEDGQLVEADAWKPNKTPVNSIDKQKLYASALAIVGKDAGGGEKVTFLDTNGAETSDINKSVDGIWYSKKGTKYERLSEDKIRKAINAAIANTPGAEESIRQDYDMAVYDFQKNGGITPTPGITDENGNIYDYQQYKDYGIKQFTGAAAYNHSYSDISFNIAYQKTANSRNNRGNGAAGGAAGGVYEGQIESNVDSYSLAATNRNTSNDVFLKTLGDNSFKNVSGFIQAMKAKYPDKKISGPVTAVMAYIDANPNKFTQEQKVRLMNSSRDYVVSNDALKRLENGLSESDIEKLRFNNSLSSGIYTAGNSKYDDQIIKYNNAAWGDNSELYFDIDGKTAKELARLYEVNNLTELPWLNVTNTGDGLHLVIDKKNANYTPEFAYKLNTADERTRNAWDSVVSWFNSNIRVTDGHRYKTNANIGSAYGDATKDYFDGNGALLLDPKNLKIGKLLPHNAFHYNVSANFDDGLSRLAHTYESGTTAAANLQNKMQIKGGLEPVVSTKYSSITDMATEYDRDTGIIDTPEQTRRMKIADARLKSFFSTPGVEAGYLYQLDPKSGIYINNNPSDLRALLNAAYTSGKEVRRKFTPLNGMRNPKGEAYSSPNGYAFDIYVDKDLAKATNFTEGETVHILYAGLCDEGTGYDYGNSIDVKSQNAVANTKRSKLGSPIIGNNKYTGNTEIQYNPNTGNYKCNFAGHTREVSEEDAITYAKSLNMLQQLNVAKYMYNKGTSNVDEMYYLMIKNDNVSNSINNIAANIIGATGASQVTVVNGIINYIKYGEDY